MNFWGGPTADVMPPRQEPARRRSAESATRTSVSARVLAGLWVPPSLRISRRARHQPRADLMRRAWVRALSWRRRPIAARRYEGAILVPPHDLVAVRSALRRLANLHGRTYRDPRCVARAGRDL
jgi:hypothetical protein